MRLAIIADLRVEHTRRWLKQLENCQHDVLVLSTYPYPVKSKSIKIHILPGIFRPGDSFVKSSETKDEALSWKQKLLSVLLRLEIDIWFRPLWHRLSVLDILWQSLAARAILGRFKPDIVQAFRTQNEGYIASFTGIHPVVLFIWGQDFSLFAKNYKIHQWLTRKTLRWMDGLLADCQRDIKLARELGFSAFKPTLVLPGNGGVDLARYSAGRPAYERSRLIVYPRGFSPYLRFDNLLVALKGLLENPQFMDVRMILLMPPSLIERTRKKVESYGLPLIHVEIKPFTDQASWSHLLRETLLIVSPSVSDGTPNSMLEAMACGALPVMGRLNSIEEWIKDGQNGFLFDSEQPDEIEAALCSALSNRELCENAQMINRKIIEDRANVENALPQLFDFYHTVIQS